MNVWVCVILGIGLAILYKVMQNYKAKKAKRELQDKLQNIVKDNKENDVISEKVDNENK